MNTRKLLAMLVARYSKVTSYQLPRYIYAAEVPAAVGLYGLNARRVDFLAQDTQTEIVNEDGRRFKRETVWSEITGERRIQLHGHEIKVSRGDWLTELRKPEKAQVWKQYCDRWWLVAPVGIVQPSELPDGWGLLVPSGRGLRQVVVAPRLNPVAMPATARASFMRCAIKQINNNYEMRDE